ncbi:hypothetical protein INT45_013570 [Circinella minor]|uniref:ATP-dependent DNA helicase n=1 Tax=Circinella minor TaxID=1195481 RepID=A0A8H7VAZ5_9FUNG|nr:hypothetical protein INT45_013570 [Circinella minor]
MPTVGERIAAREQKNAEHRVAVEQENAQRRALEMEDRIRALKAQNAGLVSRVEAMGDVTARQVMAQQVAPLVVNQVGTAIPVPSIPVGRVPTVSDAIRKQNEELHTEGFNLSEKYTTPHNCAARSRIMSYVQGLQRFEISSEDLSKMAYNHFDNERAKQRLTPTRAAVRKTTNRRNGRRHMLQQTSQCRCGSTTHRRVTFHGCRLNERNVRRRIESENTSLAGNNMDIIIENPTPDLLTSNEATEEGIDVNDDVQPTNNETATPTRVCCPRCGSPEHSRSNNRACPFHTSNVQSEHGAQFQIACTVPFVPEHIFGPNISFTRGNNYRRHIFPNMNVNCPFCNARMRIDERVKSSSVLNPRFGICCTQGKIRLPLPRAPPTPLRELLTNHDESNENASDFHTHIRAYNTLFAFASIRANWDRDLANRRNGVSTFRINGTMYHCLGSLRATTHAQAQFAQIYFADTQEQLARRTSLRSRLNPDTIAMLQRVVETHNPFATTLQTASEVYRDRPFGSINVVIRAARELGRRYDQQAYPEVAAIVVESAVDGSIMPHDIIINDRTQGIRQISSLHPSYMPLHYVLLFPYGESGWYNGMRCQTADNQSANVTLLDFCAYMLVVRGDTFSHHFGRLFQQFVVDNYARIESSRLLYISTHQQDLRSELYSGIGDAVDPHQVGRSVILPLSFTGGPRYMKQMLQDGLAIIRQRGNPTLFITFTCNPKWPEIVAELHPGQKAYDRPDICARVFNMKVTELLHDIKESKCFGRVEGYVATVEFQKRGLPHIHILLILNNQDRPHIPTDYDRFVSAEIPNSVTHPQLYQTVISCMIYGPCGDAGRNALCMKDGRCSQHYPKPFNAETRISRDGYPMYLRQDNQRQHLFERTHFIADNRHVVLYNPYLSQKYDAHINTEICTSARAIKYLCKYITKGSDRAQLETTTINNSTTGDVAEQNKVIDEVVQYQNARYIGPCEAVWRTLQFRVYMHHPMVVRLDIHLPGEQMVTFRSDMTPEELELARDAAATGTKLLGFFALCNRHAEEGTLMQYTYPQIPCHYTWNDRNREWNPRTNPPVQNVVTHIYAASITNMPLYALHLLLLHIQGPISFEALRTKDGIVHSTFQEAAVAYGFLESDQERNNCLTETSLIAPSAAAIRALFIYILINSSPAEPLTLWTNHRERMADDYFFQMCRELSLGNEEELLPNQLDQIYQCTLGDIETRLQATGHHLSEFPSMPQEFITELDCLPQLQSLEIVERREYNVEEQEHIARELIPGLNEGQRHAFDSITAAINAPDTEYNPHVFFVNGPGGTGKSQLFKALLSHVRSQNQIALPVASSGIAATLLPSGRIAHSHFKIPLNADDNTTCNLRLGGSHAYLIQRASLIIWDEAVIEHQ